MPARCSALTMSRNSSTGPSGVLAGNCSRHAARRTIPGNIPSNWPAPAEQSCASNWNTGSSSTAVMPRSPQVRDLLDHAGIRAARRLRHDPELGWRVKPRDVHLVDDCPRQNGRRSGASPSQS